MPLLLDNYKPELKLDTTEKKVDFSVSDKSLNIFRTFDNVGLIENGCKVQ